jgi:peptide/nickel transport system substrate-binding protein
MRRPGREILHRGGRRAAIRGRGRGDGAAQVDAPRGPARAVRSRVQASEIQRGGSAMTLRNAEVERTGITRRALLKGATLSAAALTVGVPGAAGAQPKRGGVLRVVLSDGNSGDSLLATKMPNTWTPIMFLTMYEPIIRLDNGFQPHPGLVERWENSNDAKRWTFHLRRGVTFHDGTPLTAKDVAYSLRFVMRKEAATYTGSLLRPYLSPDKITALDRYTVRLDLDKKFVFVPNVLGIRYSLVFKEGTTDNDLLKKKPVGTGPFMFKEFTPGQSFSAVRNPHYWDQDKPYVDEIRMTNIPEEASKFQALLANQADLVGYTDFAMTAQLKGDSSHEPFPFKDAAWNGLCCNLTVEPFTKPQVIKAMKLGVDREQFINTAFAGLATVGYDGPIPGSDPFFPPDLKPRRRDVAGARGLLREAGYPNGLDLPFDLVTVTSLGVTNIAQVAKEQLAEVGIRFNIRQGGPTFWDTVYLHQPFIVPDWNRRHPFEIYGLLTTTENMTKFKSADLEAALNAAAATTDFNTQRRHYGQAIKITAEQDGYVVPAYSPRLHAKSTKLQGVRPNFVSFLDFSAATLG